MYRSEYHIAKMDCPSEENMIRVKLDGLHSIKKLDFDIKNRKLFVYHTDRDTEISTRLDSINLGAKLTLSEEITSTIIQEEDHKMQRNLLWSVLIINFAFFLFEMTTGLISRSMGLIADSLDMLADSFVYGLSLWAVGSTAIRKQKVASLSGYFQLTLATLGIIEVIRRFFESDSLPDFRMMIIVSVFALVGNAACLYLLQKSKSDEAHMKASMIFTSNDVIINGGVIMAGLLVLFTQSKYPDLIIGTIVFIIVVRGAIRILKLAK